MPSSTSVPASRTDHVHARPEDQADAVRSTKRAASSAVYGLGTVVQSRTSGSTHSAAMRSTSAVPGTRSSTTPSVSTVGSLGSIG